VEQDKIVVIEAKIKNTVISRTKLPYIIFDMLGDGIWKHCAVDLEKFYVQGCLFILYAGVFAYKRFFP
jgi:hypothetical protein